MLCNVYVNVIALLVGVCFENDRWLARSSTSGLTLNGDCTRPAVCVCCVRARDQRARFSVRLLLVTLRACVCLNDDGAPCASGVSPVIPVLVIYGVWFVCFLGRRRRH